MTQDELARMPEGGWTWKIYVHPPHWAEVYGGMGLVCRVSERNARQIVGSVNAAILRNRFGWPSTKQPLDEEGKQIERDIDFWLNYAKGNA